MESIRKIRDMKTPKGFLTASEVAEQLGVLNPTVRNWIRRGKLPAERQPGYAWLIRRIDLRLFRKDWKKSACGRPRKAS